MKKSAQITDESINKVVNYLVKHPQSDAATIEKNLKIAKPVIHAIMRTLEADKKIAVYQSNAKSVKKFSMLSMPSVEKAKDAKRDSKETVNESKKQPDSKADVTKDAAEKSAEQGKNFGRDFSKLMHNGQELRKGKYILVQIQELLKRKPMTFGQLKKVLPDELVRVYGVFTEHVKARKMNQSGKQRYFCKHDQVIKLKDGEAICITNQISKHNFDGIVAAIKAAD